MDALLQPEAARRIGRRHPALLGPQQARQDGDPAQAQRHLDVLRQGHQRRGQDIGEDQIIGPVAAHPLIVQARGVDEAGVGLVQGGVLVGDPHRGGVDVGADRDPAAGPRRRDGQDARAAADIQNPLEPFALQQIVEGLQTADRRAVVAGAEGGAGVDLQIDGVGRHPSLVMRPIDEEAPGAPRRQARQGHGQPVGVGQLLDRDGDRIVGQGRLQPLDLLGRGREGVDAPDVAILVLLQDGIGRALQRGIGVDGGGGGLCVFARPPCDYLNCRLGHFSNTAKMTNQCDPALRLPDAAGLFNEPRGRGIHGQVTVYV